MTDHESLLSTDHRVWVGLTAYYYAPMEMGDGIAEQTVVQLDGLKRLL